MGWFKMDYSVTTRTDLTATAKVVYGILADHARQSGVAWPGRRRLSRLAGCSPETIRQALSQLEEARLVERIGNVRGSSARFQLCPTGTDSGPGGGTESGPPAAAEVVQNLGRGCPESGPVVVQNLATETERDIEAEKNTPLPPKGGKSAYDPIAHFSELTAGTNLDDDAVRQAWAEWVAYRRERRKALTKMTVTRQVSQLRDAGPVGTCNAIEESISHGWQGLFPGRNGHARAGSKAGQGTAGQGGGRFGGFGGSGDSRPAWRRGELPDESYDVPDLTPEYLPDGDAGGAGAAEGFDAG